MNTRPMRLLHLARVSSVCASLALFCVTCYADGFNAVQCGADVRKALLGSKSANETVMAIEGRHKDLQLKDLGASEISDNLTLSSWLICGDEYAVLEDKKGIVRDVLKFPRHSKEAPEFVGPCEVNGKEMKESATGVLKDDGGTMLAVTSAWKIDERQMKLVPLPAEGVRCSRDFIITADGGR